MKHRLFVVTALTSSLLLTLVIFSNEPSAVAANVVCEASPPPGQNGYCHIPYFSGSSYRYEVILDRTGDTAIETSLQDWSNYGDTIWGDYYTGFGITSFPYPDYGSYNPEPPSDGCGQPNLDNYYIVCSGTETDINNLGCASPSIGCTSWVESGDQIVSAYTIIENNLSSGEDESVACHEGGRSLGLGVTSDSGSCMNASPPVPNPGWDTNDLDSLYYAYVGTD